MIIISSTKSRFVLWTGIACALALTGCGKSTDVEDFDASEIAEESTLQEGIPYPDSARVIPDISPDDPDLTRCNAHLAAPFIGREADSGTRGRLYSEVAPITNVRWVNPGEAVTEELIPDRLNVMLGEGDIITSLSCG